MAELFRSEIKIYGKHAQYLEALCPPKENAKNDALPLIERKHYLFDRFIDVYMTAPMVGFLYKRKSPRDTSGGNRSIFAETVANEYNRLVFTYQLITILDRGEVPELSDRLDRAFRDLGKDDPEGKDVFDQYVRGGIEVLYEKLVADAGTPDDLVGNLMDFMDDFNEKFYEASSGLDIDELLAATK